MNELTWNMPTGLTYQAGQEIHCDIDIVAPSDGEYYVKGGLYTSAGLISGTEFYLYSSAGTIVVNDPSNYTTWDLLEGEKQSLTGILTLSRSDAILILKLYELSDTTPDPDTDTLVDSVSSTLTSPSGVGGFDLNSIIVLMIVVGMMAYAMKSIKF